MSEPTPVDAAEPPKKTSEIIGPVSNEATVQMNRSEEKCYWNDAEFSPGAKVSTGGKCYECCFGRWVETKS